MEIERQEQTYEEAEAVKQEEEQDEEEATLQLRKTRTVKNESESIESDAAVDSEVNNSDTEHEVQQEMAANGTKGEDLVLEDEQKIDDTNEVLGNGIGSINGEHKSENTDEALRNGTGSVNGDHKSSENLVFFDKVEGQWKCRVCTWTYGNGSVCLGHFQNHKGQLLHKLMNFKTLNFDEYAGVNSAPECNVEKKIEIDTGHNKVNGSSFVFAAENNSASITSDKKAEDLGIEQLSNSKLQPSEISVEESSTSYQTSGEIERVEDDQIIGDDLEVTDYDVEGVLQKQNTHDLYCPNCKSCITRRVILRKRKRTIRISGEEVKRNKVEAALGDKVGAGSVHRPGDDSQVPTVDDNDDDRDREPFIFKCLSCFTFFIPIGFKDRSAKETVQGQQPSNTKKNWFFTSMFPANKQEMTEQGSSVQNLQTDVQKQSVGVSASVNLGDQSAQTSLSQATTHSSKGLSGTTVNIVNLDVEDNKIIPSPEEKSSSDGKGKLSAANEVDSTAVETVDVSVGQLESYTNDQLYESKVSKQVHSNKENHTFQQSSGVTTNGVYEEHAKGRSKLMISSDKESLSTRTLEESQKPNLTSETDKEAILLPPSISVHRDSDTDGKISISMAIPQEQQQDFRATIVTESIFDEKNANQIDRDSGLVYHAEASQHVTTKTQFHVHSDETLKVDSISTISNASAAQGKDSLITIDVHPSQPVQGIIAPPETSMQPSTQISIDSRQKSDQAREESQIEIVKSIVYGGLAESITSLSVVSSAAGGGAKTRNILALGMANLIGGLLILCHNIWELRSDNIVEVANQVSDVQVPQRRDRYREILGRRENFILHFVVSLTSYLVFGLVPPVAYGFSFRKSDDTELKLLVAAASSLLCICMLAIGRAYVQRPPKPYVTSVTTFVILGFFVSGVSYAAGVLVERLLEKLGMFDNSGSVANLLVPEMVATSKTWASY